MTRFEDITYFDSRSVSHVDPPPVIVYTHCILLQVSLFRDCHYMPPKLEDVMLRREQEPDVSPLFHLCISILK
jgi:hypothetical protein